MKRGNLEIKEDMDDSFVLRANNYSVYRIGNMQDLKDLRSLIDTVLGEEEVEFPLNSVADIPIGGDVIVKLEDGRIIEGTIKSQPLTEGECRFYQSRYWPNTCTKCEKYKSEHKPQESNKEGEPLQKAFTRGNSCLSKKPSMTIGCMECGNNIKI